MKKWFAEHKRSVILSVALTLLPMLIGLVLWNQLPDTMASHWGADGAADGTTSKTFVVFGFPVILAAVNMLCFVGTALDPKQAKQSKKAMGLIFWIVPMVSFAVHSTIYALAMDRAVDMFVMLPLLMGVLFVVMGNYMPKVSQNSTFGIKISWTLKNEENWNKTHRLAGKVWVAGGIALMLAAFLPSKWMVAILLAVTLILVIVPMVYSFAIYRAHKAQGISYVTPPRTKQQKITLALSLVLVAAISVFVVGIMFTGDIVYTCQEESLRIEAHYVNGMELPYEQMDSIELRESFDIGVRGYGFGSVRLSMGTFENDEFPIYVLYSYNSCESMIIIRSGEKVLAINAETRTETQELYETLLQKIG